jgi:hypothetical protein
MNIPKPLFTGCQVALENNINDETDSDMYLHRREILTFIEDGCDEVSSNSNRAEIPECNDADPAYRNLGNRYIKMQDTVLVMGGRGHQSGLSGYCQVFKTLNLSIHGPSLTQTCS